MPSKVLLKKDWKQVSLLWILLVFLGIVAFTVPVWTQMQVYEEQIRDMQENPSNYSDILREDVETMNTEDFFNSNSDYGYLGGLESLIPMGVVIFLFVIFGALMASVLIGSERNSQMSDFSMSLPYTRTQLYISKWVIGAAGITVATLVGGALMFLIIRFSDYFFLLDGNEVKVLGLIVFLLLSGISFFSVSLWMGSFGGESISQVVWTFVALVFPMGIVALIQGSVIAFSPNFSYTFFEEVFESVPMRILSPLNNIVNTGMYSIFDSRSEWTEFLTIGLSSSIAFIVLTFGLGLWMFKEAPQENNGRFFMFSNWLWLIHIVIIICFAMLGGVFFSGIFYPQSVMLYVVGFVIGAFLAHLLAKRLLYRFNLKLKS
ncbi:ABC transporter permease subunit [Exiguobacterium aestuarii]|uniref:ABC transporter permease subunit n=1 Tax=Exiguobacterium aestuarii TaxID=273527 RepID=A0ABW2PLQ4_9BACL|nr:MULTISPECIES: ABC transporter permease subunit [Exiguobacterium]MCT4784749.1 ABC transporter permease [Exiguobacterium aestuarii]